MNGSPVRVNILIIKIQWKIQSFKHLTEFNSKNRDSKIENCYDNLRITIQ